MASGVQNSRARTIKNSNKYKENKSKRLMSFSSVQYNVGTSISPILSDGVMSVQAIRYAIRTFKSSEHSIDESSYKNMIARAVLMNAILIKKFITSDARQVIIAPTKHKFQLSTSMGDEIRQRSKLLSRNKILSDLPFDEFSDKIKFAIKEIIYLLDKHMNDLADAPSTGNNTFHKKYAEAILDSLIDNLALIETNSICLYPLYAMTKAYNSKNTSNTNNASTSGTTQGD